MLKFVNLQYDKSLGEHPERNELIILLVFCLIESVRIHLGSKGSLSEHGKRVSFNIELSTENFKLFFFKLQHGKCGPAWC